jgi:threonyl-tRNA synthetase
MPGEGAFYGPKIEFEIKDCLSRSWTTGSVQLDFSMPVRLNAEYVDEDGSKKHPVMLHRAICGSLERFIGILIEHYAGKLPVWLAPVQVVLTGISNKQDQYLQEVERNLRKLGVRTQIDLRNEKIGFKIREHTLSRVPFIVIAGEKEQSLGQITVRKQDGTDLGALSIDALTGLLLAEIEKKVE